MQTKRENIVSHSIKMFMEKGIKSVKMDDIAVELAVSKRTIYELFGNKENLVEESIVKYHENLNSKKGKLLAKASNVIEEFILLLDDIEQDRDRHQQLMEDVKKYYPRIYENIARSASQKGYVKIKARLISGVQEGMLLKEIDYGLAVAVLSYSIYGIFTRQGLTLPPNVSEDDAFRYVITYFLRGVATEKGIKIIDDYINQVREA